MIQIDAPCCDATLELEPEAQTVRCDDCGLVHVLAPDARLVSVAANAEAWPAAIAA